MRFLSFWDSSVHLAFAEDGTLSSHWSQCPISFCSVRRACAADGTLSSHWSQQSKAIRDRTAAATLISRDGDGRGQCQSAPFLSAARLLPAVADSCSLFVKSASPARCCEGGSSFVASPAALPVRSGCAGGVAVVSSCRFPAAADDAAPGRCAAADSCPSGILSTPSARRREGGSSFVALVALPVCSGCAGGVAVASSCRFQSAAADATSDCCAATDSCPSGVLRAF